MWEIVRKHSRDGIRVVRLAPVASVTMFLIVATCIWSAMIWRYEGVIANRDSIIANRDGIIANRDGIIANRDGTIKDLNSRISTLSDENARVRVAIGIDPATPNALLTLRNRELQTKALAVAARLRDMNREYTKGIEVIEAQKSLSEKEKFDRTLSFGKELNGRFQRELRAEAYNIDFELRRRLGRDGVRGIIGIPELVDKEDGSRISLLQVVAAADMLGVNMGFLGTLAFGIEQMALRLPPTG